MYFVCVCLWCVCIQIYIYTCSCSAGDTGDMGSIPGSGRSPDEGRWQLIPVFLPGNPMDRGAWQAAVQRVATTQTQLSD